MATSVDLRGRRLGDSSVSLNRCRLDTRKEPKPMWIGKHGSNREGDSSADIERSSRLSSVQRRLGLKKEGPLNGNFSTSSYAFEWVLRDYPEVGLNRIHTRLDPYQEGNILIFGFRKKRKPLREI